MSRSDNHAKVLEMTASGMRQVEIARALGIRPESVYDHLKREARRQDQRHQMAPGQPERPGAMDGLGGELIEPRIAPDA